MNFDTSDVFFEKTDLVWSLQKTDPLIWKNLEELDPSAIEMITLLGLQDQTPICKKLDSFNTRPIVRPEGSRRAFYIRLTSGGVLAIKGTEIRNSDLKRALEDDEQHKLPNRPWTKFENFIFREQKLPLALSLNEALDENSASLRFQQGMIKSFGAMEVAPVPLFIHKWSKEAIADYTSTVIPYLNSRARDLAKLLLKECELGVSVYYYQHVPHRIRFSLPKQATSFINRLGKLTHHTDNEMSCNPQAAVEKLLDITTKMLMAGFLPFAFHDHGIGQCIAPQNVTVRGGIADMGSLFPFQEVKSDRDFYELFLSMIVMLTATIREFLVTPFTST